MGSKAIYALGFIGQFFFSMRFILQWFVSERQKKSVIPTGFWYLSLVGGLLLLTYAIIRKDPVFILGQAFGSVIYLRNLQFVKRENSAAAELPLGDGAAVAKGE